jgi:microsomal epoxide hydrolase
MQKPEHITDDSLDNLERQALARGEEFVRTGTGYSQEQRTRPSTIGLVLASNPLALLAWIGEKFLEWSDVDPSLDTILESVMLYWLTEAFPRAIYPYREVRHSCSKIPFYLVMEL